MSVLPFWNNTNRAINGTEVDKLRAQRDGAGCSAGFAVICCISVHSVAADDYVVPQDFSTLQVGTF
jgi:hypothetical protein